MHAYFQKQDFAKMYENGDKALAINPDDVSVLVQLGWVTPHNYDPNDIDAAKKLQKAEEELKHGLEVLDKMAKPAAMTDEVFAKSKASATEQAHSGLGLVYFREQKADGVSRGIGVEHKGPDAGSGRFVRSWARLRGAEEIWRCFRRVHEVRRNQRTAANAVQAARRSDQTAGRRAAGRQAVSRYRSEQGTRDGLENGGEARPLEETLGYQFGRPELLELALTHRSARQRDLDAPAEDNERLEFFGDRVLGLIASEYLVQTYPDWDAGKLSKAHSRLVSGTAVRAAAQALDLGRYLRLGRGEEMTGGREKQSLLADAYEAVIAAIYLDGGIEAARSFIRRSLLDPAILHSDQPLHLSDYKSALQEWVQQHARGRVEYRVSARAGPTTANCSKSRRG